MSWIRGITFIGLAAVASMGGCGRPSRITTERSSASFPHSSPYTFDNSDLEKINNGGKAGKNFRDLTWEDMSAYFHGTEKLASDFRALNGNKRSPVELRGSHHEAACRADEALGGEENPFCFIPDIVIGTPKVMSRSEIARSLPLRPKRGSSRAKSSQALKGSRGARRVSGPLFAFAAGNIQEGARMGHWIAVVRNVSGSSLEGSQIEVRPNTRALIVNGVTQSGRNLRLNLYYAYSGQISLTIMVNGTQAGQVQFTIPEPSEEN